MSKIDVMTAPDENTPKVVSHRGKILDPADAQITESPQPAQELEDKPKEIVIENPSDNEISENQVAEPAEESFASEEAQPVVEQPGIIEANQYHLPIKATHHHRRGSAKTTIALFVLLILVIILAYFAADMDMYDPGFELPFDLL
jgi:hypothetical protein